jgi:hypothetical protein
VPWRSSLLAIAARRVLGGCVVEDLVRLEAIVLRWTEENKKSIKREPIGDRREGTRGDKIKRCQSPPVHHHTSRPHHKTIMLCPGPKKMQHTPKERNNKKCKKTPDMHTGKSHWKSTRKLYTCQLQVNPKKSPKL